MSCYRGTRSLLSNVGSHFLPGLAVVVLSKVHNKELFCVAAQGTISLKFNSVERNALRFLKTYSFYLPILDLLHYPATGFRSQMWRNNTPFTTIGIQLSGSFTGRVFQQLPTDVHSHLGLNGDVAVYDNFSLMLPPSKTI